MQLPTFDDFEPLEHRRPAGRPEGKPTVVSELQSRHREIVRLHIVGLKNVEIAERLHITPVSVGQTLRSPIVQQHLRELQGKRDETFVEIAEELEELLYDAHRAYAQVLRGEVETTPMQRVKVASEVFDRTGYGKQTTVNHSKELTKEDILEIKATALQAKQENDEIEDGTLVPVSNEDIDNG